MDGLYMENPMNKWMIWGVFPYFWKHPFGREGLFHLQHPWDWEIKPTTGTHNLQHDFRDYFTHILGVEDLHFSMGFGGPRVYIYPFGKLT